MFAINNSSRTAVHEYRKAFIVNTLTLNTFSFTFTGMNSIQSHHKKKNQYNPH